MSIKLFIKQTPCLAYSIQRNPIRQGAPITIYSKRKRTTTAVDNKSVGEDTDKIGETADDSFTKALPFSKIPGPGGLRRFPYIGTLLLFKPFTKFTIETFTELACELHRKHGSVFRVRLGKNYSVHTCNVEDIERIFSQEPKYPLRRLMDLSRVYRERNGLPQGMTSCSGEEWHRMRKPMNLVLKRRQSVLGYLPALNKVAGEFAARLGEVKCEGDISSTAADMNDLFFRFASESVGVVCFNERLGFLDPKFQQCPEKKKLLTALRNYISYNFKAIKGVEKRYKETENDPFYQLYARNMNYIRQQAKAYVDRAMQASKTLTITEESSESSKNDDNLLLSLLRRRDLGMEEILANIESMLIAGSESTARVLSVLLYDLAKHPDTQERVAAEILSHAGQDGPITADIIDDMRLVKACVKESMRLHYPVSTGIERTMTNDTVVSGYRVPAGTSVKMTGAKTSKDPHYFPDPFAFRPESWLKDRQGQTNAGTRQDRKLHFQAVASSGVSVRGSRLSAFAFIPFGHGARSCVGSNFAQIELLVGMAKIIQKMHISVHPSYGELKICHTPFITPVEPIPFIFSKR